ncbi:DUF5988 family protein [Streptomyces sp. AN091965]|uniref:DUF5988 family protein n=1 Tax=Streptomyces sp. AN091965 TaxID=2927803 RepID=UPI001F60AA36|nr:DUF5988 family protein [Streptomyces sp. AN091965]MCI3928024.1 DUF5988 family protein [Streptomyces sp. AN091965]
MRDSDVVTGSGQLVVLAGGPSGMARLHRLPAGQTPEPERLTVAFYGQHQHFERTGDNETVDGCEVPVFRWTYRTKIAE